MSTLEKNITVETVVVAPIEKVWDCWTQPEHIVNWNFAIDEWHAPRAQNDLKPGGSFNFRMEAKDGSMGFDFGGIYDEVIPMQKIRYTLGDNRKVEITFAQSEAGVVVRETFEAETMNPIEMQRDGWKAILENFRKYAERV